MTLWSRKRCRLRSGNGTLDKIASTIIGGWTKAAYVLDLVGKEL
jgi:hypothetical protein